MFVFINVFSSFCTYLFFLERSDPLMAKIQTSMVVFGGAQFLIGFAGGQVLARVQRTRLVEDSE